jgi:hypothetical protein
VSPGGARSTRWTRSTRDRLLGAAAGVAAAGELAFVVLVATKMGFGWLRWFDDGRINALAASALLLALVGSVIGVGALAYFSVALVGQPQKRDSRARRAACILAGGYAALFVGGASNLFLGRPSSLGLHLFAWTLLTALCYALKLVAVALVAKAFSQRRPAEWAQDGVTRSRLLGLAGIYSAVGAVLFVGTHFAFDWPSLGFADRMTFSYTAGFVSSVVAVLAWAVAAVGLLCSLRAGKEHSPARLRLRETWLVAASSIYVLVWALQVVYVTPDHALERHFILTWALSTRFDMPLWFQLIRILAWTLAAMLAAVGFAASRRALAQRG